MLTEILPTFSGFASLLQRVGIETDGEDLADILWLALQIDPTAIATPEPDREPDETTPVISRPPPLPPTRTEEESTAAVYTSAPKPERQGRGDWSVIPFRAPAAPTLLPQLAIARALRPLMRKVPSLTQWELDEEATAVQIAEERVWTTVMRPKPERWLSLAIVIEDSKSLPIWEEMIAEFRQLMERQGAFRDVRIWYLQQGEGEIRLSAGRLGNDRRSHSPKELLDPVRRQVILLVSDCVSELWRSGAIKPLLDEWTKQASLTVLQMFPERMWERSALGAGIPVGLSNEQFLGRDAALRVNAELLVDEIPRWLSVDAKTEVKLPIVTLEPNSLQRWGKVMGGSQQDWTAGVVFDDLSLTAARIEAGEEELSAEERVGRFWATASLGARRLAGLMAVVPVTLPIVHLLQRELMPHEASPVLVAEVFMSGLLAREGAGYEFYGGVRDELIAATPISQGKAALEEVILRRLSKVIEERTGRAVRDFVAFLEVEPELDGETKQEVAPFARIARQVFRQWGGVYAELADRPRQPIPTRSIAQTVGFPTLRELEFETVQVEIDDSQLLQSFTFEMATIEIQRKGIRRQPKIVINKTQRQTWGYTEPLSETLALEMIQIPAGSFLMGSPEEEPERFDWESPQHEVTVEAFFIGKYPITQAQWRAVATLPQIEQPLDLDPSEFKGEDRPVEKVSWLEVKEFCARLSQLSQKQYRLPTEAEWEYACRAGTTTPFHFGETITPDLANYDWKQSYNKIKVTKEKDSLGTTPVGSFPANSFGLYDMHGNVWEWCEDHWHSNYEGAPTDGIAWLKLEEKEPNYVVRGGSWLDDPRYCRSASRNAVTVGFRDVGIGFRVVCAASRTQ